MLLKPYLPISARAAPLLVLALAAGPVLLQADESHPSTSAERAARSLLASTVTVRISAPLPEHGDAQPAPREVLVCSGVSLGAGRIATFVASSADPAAASYRITLPGGEQAQAMPRVIDRYSGLLLLELNDPAESARALPALLPAGDVPAPGGSVVTAAAAGIERPAISLGILGGVDRGLAGVDLPPLLQCDVRTTETSCGAAVVDLQGRLLGIVAATPHPQGGWTYALPASHVERLLRAHAPDKLVELTRRRPVVGFTVGPGEREGTVRVERVEAGGPAAAAGIEPGDLVLAADGRRIRSAYQAVALILRKQPGDRMGFVVEHHGSTRDVSIELAGAAEPQVLAVAETTPARLGPQLRIRAQGPHIHRPEGVQELGAGDGAPARPVRRGGELELLQIQLQAFEQVIRKLQLELDNRRSIESQTQQRLLELQAEVTDLRRQLGSRNPSPASAQEK